MRWLPAENAASKTLPLAYSDAEAAKKRPGESGSKAEIARLTGPFEVVAVLTHEAGIVTNLVGMARFAWFPRRHFPLVRLMAGLAGGY